MVNIMFINWQKSTVYKLLKTNFLLNFLKSSWLMNQQIEMVYKRVGIDCNKTIYEATNKKCL